MTDEEALAASFETQRSYLHAIAHRMLGSHADADDAVQEAWLRLARMGGAGIEDLRGSLTTVTSRICRTRFAGAGCGASSQSSSTSARSRGNRSGNP